MKHLSLFLLTCILLIPVHTLAEKPILTIDTGGHKAMIRDVMFTSSGRYLVSASDDKTVRVWDTSTGEVVRVLRGQIGAGNEGKIFAAALSPDDRFLAVGGWIGPIKNYKLSDLGSIRLIDFQTGEVIALLKGHTNIILGLAFSPDGKRLISGSADFTARIWDVRTHKTIHTLKGHTETIYAVAFSPDGTRAVTGSYDNTLKLWNANSGALIKTLKGHNGKVRSAAFTPNGEYLLSGSHDKTIRMWNGKTGKFIKVLASQNRNADSLSISPDGTKVLTGHGLESGKRSNNVFSIPSGEKLASFTKHTSIVLATDISPDGRTAATGGGSAQEIYLWDLTTGKVTHKMVGKGKTIWSVGFAKDGRSIAWGRKWGSSSVFAHGSLEQSFQIKSDSRTGDLSMGRELSSDTGYQRAIESAGAWSIRTKNGKVHKTLEILENGRVVHEITRGSADGYKHESLTLTPDGRTVISGGGNGNLISYNPQTGKKLHKFIGHTSDVWGVAASPDSRFLVSGSFDQTVRLWEIDTGKLLLTIFQGTDKEWVAWTPEGYYASSLKGDKYVGWHINRGEDKSALFYPASRFAKQFYFPRIAAKYCEIGGDIDEAIRLANLESPGRKKIKKTTLSDIGTIVPPAVFFQVPSRRDVTVQENTIRVKAGAKSVGTESITDIWLLVNGKQIGKGRGIAIKGTELKTIDGLRAEIDVTVSLTQAENRISVIASNRHTRSEPEIITVRWKTKAAGTVAQTSDIYKPDLYLLSIGVSKYQRQGYSLDFAHKDAEGIASVLNRQSGKLYGKVHKRILTDENASQDDILDGLDWILKESTQKDLSVIFVAGHGLKDDRGNYYFLPHDADPDRLRRTGIKWFDFQDVLSSLPSKVIFLVDTCHSGSATGKRRGGGDMTEALRELVLAESGVVVMTASTGKESSQERPEWGHGAFTKALIEGLEGKADYDGDNTVDVKEIDLFISKRVKALTNGGQHPTTEIPKTMPNFPLVYK
ncbi:MAG: caspase family protein [Syntrophaceae bacterium]|nr:caspase family protein [Syntrophaceae bacterium]